MKTLKMFFSVLFFITISNAQAVYVHPSDMGQIESPIAINPTNPDNFIGAAVTQDTENHIGYYYTLNGGIYWQGQVQTLTVHDDLEIRSLFHNWSASGADLQYAYQNQTGVVSREPNDSAMSLPRLRRSLFAVWTPGWRNGSFQTVGRKT